MIPRLYLIGPSELSKMNKNKSKQDTASLLNRPKQDIVKTYIESKAKADERKEINSESDQEEYVLKVFNEFSIEESIQEIKKYIGNEKAPKDMASDYKRWKEFFDKEMNICLFGIGSKKRIMDEFVDLYYKDCMQIRIKGYNSSVKVDNIFMKLLQALEVFADFEIKAEVQKVLGMKKHKSTSTVDVLTKLLNNFEKYGQTLVVLFYDIDGKNFRELESHAYLSKVFKCRPSVKLIASFSNSNFPYLFNKDMWINYNFTFYPTHTYELYENELTNDEIYWFNKKQMKGSNAIKVIYKSLTDTQKYISPNHLGKCSNSYPRRSASPPPSRSSTRTSTRSVSKR